MGIENVFFCLALFAAQNESPAPQNPYKDLPQDCGMEVGVPKEIVVPYGRFKPEAGDWVTYALVDEKIRAAAVIKYEITGKEKFGGEDAYWIEISIGDGTFALMRVRMLATRNPSEKGAVKRVLLALGGSEFEEMAVKPAAAFDPAAGSGPNPPCKPLIRQTASQKVSTPAGTFDADVIEVTAKEQSAGGYKNTIKLSPSIPIFNIVSIELPDGRKMEVLKYGRKSPRKKAE